MHTDRVKQRVCFFKTVNLCIVFYIKAVRISLLSPFS